jgi:hypothetical protein
MVAYHQYITVQFGYDNPSALVAARCIETTLLEKVTPNEVAVTAPLLPFIDAPIHSAKVVDLNGQCHLVGVDKKGHPVTQTPDGEPLRVMYGENLEDALKALQFIERVRNAASGHLIFSAFPRDELKCLPSHTSHYSDKLAQLRPRPLRNPVSNLQVPV